MAAEAPSEPVSLKTYIRVFIALLVLLAIPVAVAFIPSGRHLWLRDMLTGIAFVIAAAKALLIVLWFMLVKAGTRMTWFFSAAGFVWLVILFGLTLNDYLTRGMIPESGTEEPRIVEPSGAVEEFNPDDRSRMRPNRLNNLTQHRGQV